MIEKMRRPPETAPREKRVEFVEEFRKTLDKLGVMPGDEFLVSKANSFEKAVASSDQNALGPFVKGSATSRKASVDNYPRSGTQRHKVLLHIISTGDYGATRDEIAVALGMSGDSVRPRLLEVIEPGWAIPTERERKTRLGSMATVVVATESGRAEARKHGDLETVVG